MACVGWWNLVDELVKFWPGLLREITGLGSRLPSNYKSRDFQSLTLASDSRK